MDFHSLARRDLQALCKKNKIPANMTNVAMADALRSVQSIEWDEEIKQKLTPRSEANEHHGSPLPRSRRVTAKSMEDVNDQEEEETKKEALIEANKTPATTVRRSQRLQSAMSTRTYARTATTTAGKGTCTTGTTRRGRSREEPPTETGEVAAAETPVMRHGQKKAVETPAEVVIPRSSARATRQSSRRLAESTKDTRFMRNMAKMMVLEQDDDKESQTEVLEITETTPEHDPDMEGKANLPSDTASEQKQEEMQGVVALGQAAEPNSTENMELFEEAEAIDPVKEDEEEIEEREQEENKVMEGELVGETGDDKEYAEENVEEGFDISTVIPISEEEKETPEEKSASEIEESDESVEGELSSKMSEQKVGSLLCDELDKDSKSFEELAEDIVEEGSDMKSAPISEEEEQVAPEKEEREADQTALADSPILGLVSEPMPKNGSDLLDAPPSDITLDAQDSPTEICVTSPVKATADEVVDKMLDSVVRCFAKASIHDSTKNVGAFGDTKGETEKVGSDVASLEQNENAVKERVNLHDMSLRKLKAMYKEQLIELNHAKVDGGGKRLALAQLDENVMV